MGSPVAVFPTAVVDDKQLRVANNNISNTLALAILGSSDTTFTCVNATGIVPKSIVTIDNEKIAVYSVAGNVVTVGYSSSGNVDGRGFDGTSAAAHASGATVALNIDAWHHNALKEEVKAIEAALGANLSNIPSGPPLNPHQYAFAAQQPGGSLVIGGNVITFPGGIPAGITADSANIASVYLSGGSGAAEAVPITAVNVGANQIVVTCANTHSGAWTVQSATGGWQEAVMATAGRGRVLGAGVVDLYAGIVVPGSYFVSLRGVGMGVTQFRTHSTTGDWIYFPKGSSGYVDCGDFSIVDNAGSFHGAGSMVRFCYKVYGSVSNIEVEHSFWGITSESNQNVQPFNCIVGTTKYGIYITTLGVVNGVTPTAQSAGAAINCVASLVGTGGAAIQVEGTTVGLQLIGCLGSTVSAGAQTRALQFLVNSAVGPLNEIMVIGGIYDAGGLGIGIIGDGVSYANNWIVFEGVECNGFEYGFYADAKVANIKWVGGYIKCAGGAAQQGVFLRNVQNAHFSDVDIDCPALALSVDTVTDLVFDGIRLGRNGTVPSSGLTFNNAPTRMTVQNCDFGAIATVANRITNPATAGANLTLANNSGVGNTTLGNYIASETGANNAIVVSLPGVPLGAGLRLRILLAHTLQAGANTCSVNGTVLNIKSSRNPANNIAVAYASTGTIELIHDGTQLQDVSQ